AFHDEQRCSVTHWAVDRFRKEVPQLKYTLRGVRKFVSDSATHCRRMHADFLGDILDHHWLQLINALVEEIALSADDCLANFHDDVLSLLDVFQQLYGRLET